MKTRIKKEEYTTLGDFVKTSFVRDQATIMQRFPKLDANFLADFTQKLEQVKTLESGLVLTTEQKNITASLYDEATTLNRELNFLNSYITSAGLTTRAVTELKNDLTSHNIEGALSKIESVKQFITIHSQLLEEEGMAATFAATLETHKTSLSGKNSLQNSFMNTRKSLTESNRADYELLYEYISKITEAGKLVFGDTLTEDEYIITKLIARMRAPKRNKETTTNN